MAIRLLLIRHGESEWNAAGRWQGHQGSGLTARGRAQAEATAAFLAAHRREVVRIARSDLDRVAETAAPAERRLDVPVQVDVRLREIDVGVWAGRTHAEVEAADPGGYAAWRRGEDRARGGGETFAQLRTRVRAALLELAAEAGRGTVLVYTHGGPVRVAVAEALSLPPGGERRLGATQNCSITELSAADGTLMLDVYNSTSHLAIVG